MTDLMPMIGARFYTQLDAVQSRSDTLESELSKELDNGRLFRLLTKLGTINERQELNMDPAWAETGDRYMLKLFRDYIFHQVTSDGRPWLDMSHIVSCLNKLDTASPDKVQSSIIKMKNQNLILINRLLRIWKVGKHWKRQGYICYRVISGKSQEMSKIFFNVFLECITV